MANESNAAVIKWFKPVIEALKALGGSGKPKDVCNWIIEHENLDDEVVNQQKNFENEVAWARNSLREGGYIDGPKRGVWRLTEKGKSVDMTHGLASEILKDSRRATKARKTAKAPKTRKNAQIEEKPRYWWLNANPQKWRFSDLAVGGTESYDFKTETGKKRSNFSAAEVGDMVIVYASDEVKKVVGIACVSEKRDGDKLFFKKVEGLDNPISKADLGKGNPELQNKFKQQSSLVKLNKDEYDFIIGMIRKENPGVGDEIELPQIMASEKSGETYTKADFLKDVYMKEEDYNNLVNVLKYKKNVILQGAPGVGKTFAAKRLAWSMMREKDNNRIEFVQFHQNYSYEDFVMGYKPDKDGFKLKNGIFYRFCKKAEEQPDRDFFFIIDEINRGNMSKIFGELLMLIEKDYRNTPVTLAYKENEQFSVPENLYIIGMMNTADRSLAMIDYALRRRFSFFDMEPAFDSKGFKERKNDLNNEMFNKLIYEVAELNKEISNDKSLGKGFCIGHSYFCGIIDKNKKESCSKERLKSIVEYDILPMLREYWFDDTDKLKSWETRLKGCVND